MMKRFTHRRGNRNSRICNGTYCTHNNDRSPNFNKIDSNIKVAQALGITGTPTLILPDGRVHPGMMPSKKLIDFIDGIPNPEPKAK